MNNSIVHSIADTYRNGPVVFTILKTRPVPLSKNNANKSSKMLNSISPKAQIIAEAKTTKTKTGYNLINFFLTKSKIDWFKSNFIENKRPDMIKNISTAILPLLLSLANLAYISTLSAASNNWCENKCTNTIDMHPIIRRTSKLRNFLFSVFLSWLFDCLIVWLFDCLIVWLFGEIHAANGIKAVNAANCNCKMKLFRVGSYYFHDSICYL